MHTAVRLKFEIQTHFNLIRRSITAESPGVIAQHYSSVTFVALRCHSRKEKKIWR